MLNFIVIGPLASSMFLVAYKTPGCEIFTPVMECSSQVAAIREAERLNHRQRMIQDSDYYDKHFGE